MLRRKRPDVGPLGNLPVERPIPVASLDLHSDEDGIIAPCDRGLNGLQCCRELEGMTWHYTIVVIGFVWWVFASSAPRPIGRMT